MVDECWLHAEEAERAAETARNREAKRIFRAAAQQWREAAKELSVTKPLLPRNSD